MLSTVGKVTAPAEVLPLICVAHTGLATVTLSLNLPATAAVLPATDTWPSAVEQTLSQNSMVTVEFDAGEVAPSTDRFLVLVVYVFLLSSSDSAGFTVTVTVPAFTDETFTRSWVR